MSGVLIVGSGVVGQATGRGLAKMGHGVYYVDINPVVIAELRRDNLAAMTIAEVDWSQVDIVMLTVSTPTRNGCIVLDYIKSAARDLGPGLRQADHYVTVVVRSTVPPTTTEKVILGILENASGKKAGNAFGLAMNPEFLRQASALQDFAQPWITIIGSTNALAIDALRKLYLPLDAPIVVCTPTEAEMIKYVNNVYNAVKISYFNEVYAICQKLDIDSDFVASVVSRSAEAMWNPLYGTKGGVPFGGACLPKDTNAFLQFAHQLGVDHLILEATIEVNERLNAKVPAAASPDQIDAIRQIEQLGIDISTVQNTTQLDTDDNDDSQDLIEQAA